MQIHHSLCSIAAQLLVRVAMRLHQLLLFTLWVPIQGFLLQSQLLEQLRGSVRPPFRCQVGVLLMSVEKPRQSLPILPEAASLAPPAVSNIGAILSQVNFPSMSFIVAAILSLIVELDSKTAGILQDMAWSLFLQSSLILSIFSSPKLDTNFSVDSMLPMVGAFLISALGSFVGGIGAYGVIAKLTLPQGLRDSLRLVTSALTASYIGGTANYFEVMNVLSTSNLDVDASSSIINLVAGVDIAVMVVFFSALNAIRSNNIVKRWLPLRVSGKSSEKETGAQEPRRGLYVEPNKNEKLYFRHQAVKASRITKLVAASVILAKIASLVSKNLPFRGGSVMLSVAIGLFFNFRKPSNPSPLLEEFEVLGSMGSTVLLCIFYALIGLNSGFKDFGSVGIPLFILIFSILGTHLITLMGGAKLWNALFPMHSVDVDVACVASNAAIGGAATAASYASSIGRADLCMSSSLVGTVGYSLGTPLGVFLANILNPVSKLQNLCKK